MVSEARVLGVSLEDIVTRVRAGEPGHDEELFGGDGR